MKIVRERIFKFASILHNFELETCYQSRMRDDLIEVHTLVNSSFIRDQLCVPVSPVSKRNKSTDLGDFGAKPENLHTGSVFCAEED